MKIGKTTVRFPREDEYCGRSPRIVVSVEGRLGNVLTIMPYALVLTIVVSLAVVLRQNAVPPWAYSIVLPVIGLGVLKTLETRHMARLAAARVVVRDDTPN